MRPVLILLLPLLALAAGAANAADLRNFFTALPLIHVQAKAATVGKEEVEAEITVLEGSRNSARALLRTAPQYRGTINVRGYSSAKFAKKQYDLKFHEDKDSDQKRKVGLLGFPAHHKWVLGAPYVDRPLIKNQMGFELARSLPFHGGQWYAPRSRSFELFLNGRYMGVYLLTEKVDPAADRVNLGKIRYDNPEQSPFMLKVEESAKQEEGDYFKSAQKTNVLYYEPKAKDLAKLERKDRAAAQRFHAHIENVYNRFEAAVKAIEKGDTRSYRQWIDVESFQNFMLVHEVFKNLDGLRRSMYIQWKGGRFVMGPVWDFDIAMGGIKVFGQSRPKGFQVGHDWYIDQNPEVFWFRTLLKDPEFRDSYVARYRRLRQPGGPLSTGNIMRMIERMSGELKEAQARNFTVWDPNGKWSDGIIRFFMPKYRNFSYPGVVFELKSWMVQRLEWLDQNFDKVGL